MLLRCPAFFPTAEVTQSVLLVDGFNLNNNVKIRNVFHNSKYFYKYFLFSCGDRNRTYYQWIMSPKCNHYTSPLYMLKNFFFFDKSKIRIIPEYTKFILLFFYLPILIVFCSIYYIFHQIDISSCENVFVFVLLSTFY